MLILYRGITIGDTENPAPGRIGRLERFLGRCYAARRSHLKDLDLIRRTFQTAPELANSGLEGANQRHNRNEERIERAGLLLAKLRGVETGQ